MIKRARVSGQMDAGRLAELVSRPGIDPRSWASLAIVTAVQVDPAHGVFADIVLLPSGATHTARVGAVYAGDGFGLYVAPKVDDEVLVVAPGGDPAEGLVIVQRLWSASDKPPGDAATYPDDVLLQVEQGKTLRIKVTGGAEIEASTTAVKVTAPTVTVEATQAVVNASAVELGSDTLIPMDGVVTGQGIDTLTGLPYFALGNASFVVRAKKA